MDNQHKTLKTYKNRHGTMKNQSGAIKTNLELYRVVMGGSGGYRRLTGGSDDFLLQTNTHCIIIYISPSSKKEGWSRARGSGSSFEHSSLHCTMLSPAVN